MMTDSNSNVLVLEKRYRRLMVLTLCLIVLMAAQTAYTAWATRLERTDGKILRAHGLVITDDKGTARVVIGAPLPDPIILGKVHSRGGLVSGLIIADATGDERGGYVTSDPIPGDQVGNAFLTLDGKEFQSVLLLAEPDGGTTFKIWDRHHGSVMMGAGDDGPFLNLKREGSLVSAQPPGNAETSDTRPFFRY